MFVAHCCFEALCLASVLSFGHHLHFPLPPHKHINTTTTITITITTSVGNGVFTTLMMLVIYLLTNARHCLFAFK